MAKGATTVALTDFDVVLGARPQVLASINGATEKVAILDAPPGAPPRGLL